MLNKTLIQQHAWPLCGLILAWLAYAGPMLSTSTNLYLTDMYAMDVPLRIHAAEIVRQGHFPHWTSSVQCGFPLHADSQSGFLYPLFLLYVIWPTPEMNDIFMAIHFLLAGFFTYLLIVSVGAQPWGALVGAVTFMASGYMQTKHVVPGVIASTAWYPLGMYCVARAVKGSRRALWWGALVNALGILAGSVQTMLLAFTLQAAWLIYNTNWRQWKGMFQACSILFLLPLLLSAAQIAPTLKFVTNSTRSDAFLSTHLPFNEFMNQGIQWENLAQFLLRDYLGTPTSFDVPYPPWQYTPWEESLGQFNGYAAILLVPLGIWHWRARRETRFWILAIIMGLLLAAPTPVRAALYQVPIFNLFRWPAGYLLWPTLAVAVLTAAGFDRITGWILPFIPQRRRGLALGIVVTVATMAIYGAVYRNFNQFLTKSDFYDVDTPAFVADAPADTHVRLLPVARALYHYWSASESQLRNNTKYLPACFNLLAHVPAATLFGQNGTVSPRATTEFIQNRHPNFLKVAAVTHISSPTPLDDVDPDEIVLLEPVPLPDLADVELLSDDDAYFYRYLSPLPRAFMVYKTRTVEDHHIRLALLSSNKFDPSREIIVEKRVPECGVPTHEPSVHLTQPSSDEIVIDVHTSADGFLYVADTYTEEFSATLDGQNVDMLRANHAFRAVHVPVGSHQICMKYQPTSFRIGLLLSAIGGIIVVAGIYRSRPAMPPKNLTAPPASHATLFDPPAVASADKSD